MLNEKHRFYGKTKIFDNKELKDFFNSLVFDYVKIVLLFGSRAVGTQHDRSDYDFAVLVSDNIVDDGWGVLSKVWGDVGKELGLDEVDYDVIDLSNATSEMLSSINKKYIVLKGNQDDISRILG